jgi:hypothetical protein
VGACRRGGWAGRNAKSPVHQFLSEGREGTVLKLPDAFLGEAELGAELPERARRQSAEPEAHREDLSLPLGQPLEGAGELGELLPGEQHGRGIRAAIGQKDTRAG